MVAVGVDAILENDGVSAPEGSEDEQFYWAKAYAMSRQDGQSTADARAVADRALSDAKNRIAREREVFE